MGKRSGTGSGDTPRRAREGWERRCAGRGSGCGQNCLHLIGKGVRTESRGRRQRKAKTVSGCGPRSAGTRLQLLSGGRKTNVHASFSSFILFRIESVVRLNLTLGSPTKKSSKYHTLLLLGKSPALLCPRSQTRTLTGWPSREPRGLLTSLSAPHPVAAVRNVWMAFF